MQRTICYKTIKDRDKPAVKNILFECEVISENESKGIRFDHGQRIYFHSMSFAHNGKRIDLDKQYNSDNELISSSEYHEIYNSNEKLVEEIMIENGEILHDEFYEYDNNGREILRYNTDEEGNIYSSEILYDGENKESELIFKVNNELDSRVIIDRTHKKSEIEFIYDENNHLLKKSVTYFDNQSNPVYQVDYDGDGNISSSQLYVFENDKLLEWAYFDKDQTIVEWKSEGYYENSDLLKYEKRQLYKEGILDRTEILEYEYED